MDRTHLNPIILIGEQADKLTSVYLTCSINLQAKAGFVQIKNGHFYTADGKRLRIWGVNMTGGAGFPEKEDASQVATFLADMASMESVFIFWILNGALTKVYLIIPLKAEGYSILNNSINSIISLQNLKNKGYIRIST